MAGVFLDDHGEMIGRVVGSISFFRGGDAFFDARQWAIGIMESLLMISNGRGAMSGSICGPSNSE